MLRAGERTRFMRKADREWGEVLRLCGQIEVIPQCRATVQLSTFELTTD
jgi:hypothetical protein